MPCSSQPETSRTSRDAPPQTSAPILKGAMRSKSAPNGVAAAAPSHRAAPRPHRTAQPRPMRRRGALTVRYLSPSDKVQASPGVLRATLPRPDGACAAPPQGIAFHANAAAQKTRHRCRQGAWSYACSAFSAATYFYPEDRERAGHFVVDMAQILERHLVCRALLSRIEMPGSRRCR